MRSGREVSEAGKGDELLERGERRHRDRSPRRPRASRSGPCPRPARPSGARCAASRAGSGFDGRAGGGAVERGEAWRSAWSRDWPSRKAQSRSKRPRTSWLTRLPSRVASSKLWLTIVASGWPVGRRHGASAASISWLESAQIWNGRRPPSPRLIWVTGISVTPPHADRIDQRRSERQRARPGMLGAVMAAVVSEAELAQRGERVGIGGIAARAEGDRRRRAGGDEQVARASSISAALLDQRRSRSARSAHRRAGRAPDRARSCADGAAPPARRRGSARPSRRIGSSP